MTGSRTLGDIVEQTGMVEPSFFQWLWQTIVDFFSSSSNEMNVSRACPNADVAGVTSFASDDARLIAANSVIQNSYQGLGGYGRPLRANVTITFSDGGTETYLFLGTSGQVYNVPGTLVRGSGIATPCRP